MLTSNHLSAKRDAHIKSVKEIVARRLKTVSKAIVGKALYRASSVSPYPDVEKQAMKDLNLDYETQEAILRGGY